MWERLILLETDFLSTLYFQLKKPTITMDFFGDANTGNMRDTPF